MTSRSAPELAPLPVNIITGFLGSGKTTLVNRILTNRKLRIAVIVNEIGEIGIDTDLIVSTTDDMVELSNGCICCSINNGLVDAIFRVLQRTPRVDQLIVETTGLADPVPVALTFLRSNFRDLIRLDSIISTADAENFSLDLFDSQAAQNQLRYSDIILLNKCDLVESQQLSRVEAKILALKPDARIIRTIRCNLPHSLLIGMDLFQAERYLAATDQLSERGSASGVDPANHTDHDHLAEDGFDVFAFDSNRPFVLARFQQFLDTQLTQAVFRGKGILWFQESADQHICHLIGSRFSLEKGTPTKPGRNRLVLIGKNLDKARLRAELEQCVASGNGSSTANGSASASYGATGCE